MRSLLIELDFGSRVVNEAIRVLGPDRSSLDAPRGSCDRKLATRGQNSPGLRDVMLSGGWMRRARRELQGKSQKNP